jgi:hypothetical protein
MSVVAVSGPSRARRVRGQRALLDELAEALVDRGEAALEELLLDVDQA